MSSIVANQKPSDFFRDVKRKSEPKFTGKSVYTVGLVLHNPEKKYYSPINYKILLKTRSMLIDMGLIKKKDKLDNIGGKELRQACLELLYQAPLLGKEMIDDIIELIHNTDGGKNIFFLNHTPVKYRKLFLKVDGEEEQTEKMITCLNIAASTPETFSAKNIRVFIWYYRGWFGKTMDNNDKFPNTPQGLIARLDWIFIRHPVADRAILALDYKEKENVKAEFIDQVTRFFRACHEKGKYLDIFSWSKMYSKSFQKLRYTKKDLEEILTMIFHILPLETADFFDTQSDSFDLSEGDVWNGKNAQKEQNFVQKPNSVLPQTLEFSPIIGFSSIWSIDSEKKEDIGLLEKLDHWISSKRGKLDDNITLAILRTKFKFYSSDLMKKLGKQIAILSLEEAHQLITQTLTVISL